jgi:hypothetical protein
MESISPFWLFESRQDLELIAVDAVDLVQNSRYAYLMRHPIDHETVFCAHAGGLSSLQYPFLAHVSAQSEIEYEPCISRTLVNVQDQVVPSIGFISDVHIGIMAVVLVRNKFVVLNLIAEMFAHDGDLYLQDSEHVIEKTDFEKIIEKEWKKSHNNVPVMLNWIDLSDKENLDILKKVVMQFNESGFVFSEHVKTAVDEK